MSEAERDLLVARSLEDFQRRRSLGERPDAGDYSNPLGEAFSEFLEVLEIEAALDEVLDPPVEAPLPREFGAYTLVRELGRGASGIVYEALHRELGRRTAVKILRTGFGDDQVALERFRREAKTLARIEHDHIVRIYEAGHHEGHAFYAMELVEGRSLSALLREGKAPAPRELCAGLARIADALAELHASGTVHRDVKPSNIVVRKDGSMCLADFGLARSVDSVSMTETGQALGTPRYMSPEQMLGKREEIDGRTDVYGLGATIYEMIAGRPVFQTEDVRTLLRMVLSERPIPLRKVAAGVRPECERIVMKALEKRREDRYTDAGAMRDDLLAFAEGRRVRGRPVSAARRGLRTLRRQAVPIAAVVMVLVGLGLWWTGRSARLALWTVDGAEIRLEDQVLGLGRVETDVQPGDHQVELTHARFHPAVLTLSLSAGGRTDMGYVPLAPVDPEDPEALSLLARAHDVNGQRFRRRENLRSVGASVPALALLPRGRVTRDDLARLEVEVTAELETGDEARRSMLVFRRYGERIHEQPFEPTSLVNELPMPAEVLASIEEGDVVTWGVVDAHGHEFLTTFELRSMGPDEQARWALLEERVASQEPSVRVFLEARTLMGMKLYAAALRVARASVDAHGKSVVSLGLQREAYLELKLEDAIPARDLETTITHEVSDPQRAGWFTVPLGAR